MLEAMCKSQSLKKINTDNKVLLSGYEMRVCTWITLRQPHQRKTKDLNRYFTEKQVQMGNKQIKRYSNFLLVKEAKVTLTMK